MIIPGFDINLTFRHEMGQFLPDRNEGNRPEGMIHKEASKVDPIKIKKGCFECLVLLDI